MSREGPEGFWDAWQAGQWRPHTHAALQRLLTPESTLVDVGAWVGPIALWAAPLCRRVIALEPDPEAFWSLLHNAAEEPSVICLNLALAPDDRPATLYHRGHFGDSMSSLVPTGEDGVTVKALTPAALVAAVRGPAVANVNIEGSEALVLPTLAPLLVEADIPLLLSVHEPWSGPSGPERIAAAVALFGSVTRLHEDGPGFYELLCLPEGV